MEQEKLEEIRRRAKSKEDGIFKYNQYFYIVRNGRPTHVANEYSLEILEIAGAFTIRIGKAESYGACKALQSIFKEATHDNN